jgi:hypothetical protein
MGPIKRRSMGGVGVALLQPAHSHNITVFTQGNVQQRGSVADGVSNRAKARACLAGELAPF